MPQSTVATPMNWPGGTKPPERWYVYILFYAVILASIVAGCAISAIWMFLGLAAMFGLTAIHHWASRDRDTVDGLAEQLKQRQSFPTEAWGAGDRAAFAEAVSRIIAHEVGWPNWYFLPDDLLELVFYCPCGDGAEGFAISDLFVEAFGRDLKIPETDRKTFGELIDLNRVGSAE